MDSPVTTQYQKFAEEAEGALAAREDATKIRISVGSATCENASGAAEVLAEFRKHIATSGRQDIVVRQTGCTGRCSCEPIVRVLMPGQIPVKYQRVDREAVHAIFTDHILGGKPRLDHVLDSSADALPLQEFLFCSGQRCGRDLEQNLSSLLLKKLRAAGLDESRIAIFSAGCFGLCRPEESGKYTHLLVLPSRILYRITGEKDLDEIVQSHVLADKPVERLRLKGHTLSQRFFNLYGDVAFFNRQCRISLRNSGVIDPGEHLRVRPLQGLPFAVEGARQGRPEVGDQRNHALEAARPRRRGLSHRAEMADGRGGEGAGALHHLQRRRGRSRRVHGPQHARRRSVQRDRGDDHRRLRHRRAARLLLYPRRVPDGDPARPERH